jgi:hypothetical protein
MASTNETGHSKNVVNFEELIIQCTNYGVVYNPSKAALKLPALTAQLTAASAALQAVTNAKTTYNNATNAREIAFKPLRQLATKIINALAATDATDQTVDDAKATNVKIQGRRVADVKKKSAKAAAEGKEAPRTASVSQQSYDKLLDNFSQLVATLAGEPKYLPNENELKVATLNTIVTDLKAKNTATLNATELLSNARIARNKVMYAPKTGMVDTVKAVKKYVKSVFNTNSPQAKKMMSLEFTRPAND